MRTLVYKRTHNGDPDEETGTFGINGCMGQVRGFEYEAVIGVGGVGPKPRKNGIAGRLTWIGIGVLPSDDSREPLVRFEHFWYRGPNGPLLRDVAPRLAARFGEHPAPRHLLDDISTEESREIEKLLRLAEDAPPSAGLPKDKGPSRGGCRPTKNSGCRKKGSSGKGC